MEGEECAKLKRHKDLAAVGVGCKTLKDMWVKKQDSSLTCVDCVAINNNVCDRFTMITNAIESLKANEANVSEKSILMFI